MIKGVAFDLEGTAVNVEEVHFGAFMKASEELGFSCTFETIVEEIPNALGGGDQNIAVGIRKLSHENISVEELLCKKGRYYREILSTIEIKPRLGFLEVFEQIHALGLQVSIGSLTLSEQAVVLLERSGLLQLFDPTLIVLEEDVLFHKPAPDVFLETAKRMGIKPEEQLVFEDSATGVTAATAAGSPCVAIPVYWFSQNIAQLAEVGASRIFRDWREMDVHALIENINFQTSQ